MTRALGCLVLAFPAVALAGPNGPSETEAYWRAVGDLTAMVERYEVNGDERSSPYVFEGTKGTGQLNLSAERYLSRYHLVRAQLLGLVTNSEYRSRYDGFILERASLLAQDGDAYLPYRVEVGDSLGYFSYRTLQRSLKGAQIELQSPPGTKGLRHSFQALAGGFATSYRDFDINDDFSAGASWLMEASHSRLGVNVVHNHREFLDSLGTPVEPEQRVATIIGEHRFRLGSETLLIEAEGGTLWGEPSGRRATEEGSDEALFVQVSGHGSSPFSYRLRFENYGQDYVPVGTPIISDRRSGEAHLGWRLGSGATLRGRFQAYRDRRETEDPQDMKVAGLILSGPVLGRAAPGLSVFAELYSTDVEDKQGLIDSRFTTLSFDAFHSSGRAWAPRFTLFWQDRNDYREGGVDGDTTQIQLRADRQLRWGGGRALLGPGVLVRRIRDGADESDDWTPTLDLSLDSGSHSLRGSVSLLNQDRPGDDSDLDTLGYRLLYRFTRARHELGLEFDGQNRDPKLGEDTDSYRLAGYWTYRFDFGPRVGGRRLPYLPETVALGHPSRPDTLELGRLTPGSDLAGLATRIGKLGFPEPSRLDRFTVYEQPVLSEIPGRQRLALEARDGVLARSALIIEFSGLSSGSGMFGELERARQILMDRLGRPTSVYEQGDASADLRAAVNAGSFIRITEWVVPGGLVRFGIPRRLDGIVRMELQVAEDFPPYRETLWSVDEIR